MPAHGEGVLGQSREPEPSAWGDIRGQVMGKDT